MNGPPSIDGFLRAATCTCGLATNDRMIFRCELATYIAAEAGGIRYGHAYQELNKGSATTFCLKKTFSLVISYHRPPDGRAFGRVCGRRVGSRRRPRSVRPGRAGHARQDSSFGVHPEDVHGAGADAPPRPE